YLALVQARQPAGVNDTFTVTDHDVARASTQQDLSDSRSSRSGAGNHDPEPVQTLFGEPQGIEQCRQHHDRGAVLVVVKDGYIELLLQLAFNIETARGRDVLQVDPAKPHREVLDRGHNFSRLFRTQTNRISIDAGEFLEKHCFA